MADAAIMRRLLDMWAFRDCNTVFSYVSIADEVDTMQLIEKALEMGKRVAVPRCIDGRHEMEFYFINGLDELKKRSFGILEPEVNAEKLVKDFSSGLCLVPALVFDSYGYRLGYGKGYYDRFLSGFEGFTIGLCRSECFCKELPHGKFDRCVNAVVTDKKVTIIR